MDRDDNDLTYWIEEYVASLRESSEAFHAIYEPNRLGDQYSDISTETLNKLRAVDTCGAASTFRPLLMAAYLKMDVTSDEFEDLVRACEVFAVRAFEIINRSTMLLRRQLKQESHRLYVADWTQTEIEDLFGELTLEDGYNSVGDAVNQIINQIDTETGNQAPESDIIECLTRQNVISGEFNRGWGGFGSKKKTVLYLLYEYERKLRSDKGSTGLHSLVDFGTFVEEAEVEHIAPRNPSEESAKLENHNENRNRLANLAFLWPEDNQDAGNERYEKKYNEIYEDSQVALLENLPNPEKGWGSSALDSREEELVDFIVDHWSGRRKGRVFVEGGISDEVKSTIRKEIQSHYGSTNSGNNLPTIIFESAEGASMEDGEFKRHKPCSNCGGLKMEIKDEDYYCVCGSNIRVPNYQVTK